mgnify:CR=1 FL=1|jgi:hypothetical protein|tara:strand:- start:202 stop:819 length:618 start_codon:yes stop_codon:yes gene_type:complete
MFALVDKSDNSITKFLNGNRGINIGDIQYPKSIFTLWSESERNAINIYTVTIDDSKLKNNKWYINTDITYSFDGTNATGSYGDATAKAHADANAKDKDGNDLDPVIVIEGLKTKLIKAVKSNAASELAKTDWYITRKTEKNTAIPSAVTTHRDAVRSKQAAMETAITNASDTPALETLYAYVNTADEGEPVVLERPLGEIPIKNF